MRRRDREVTDSNEIIHILDTGKVLRKALNKELNRALNKESNKAARIIVKKCIEQW